MLGLAVDVDLYIGVGELTERLSRRRLNEG